MQVKAAHVSSRSNAARVVNEMGWGKRDGGRWWECWKEAERLSLFLTLPANCAKSLQSCLTLFDPMDYSLPGSSIHGDSPGKNTGVSCHALLQGIFQIHRSNPCLLCLLNWQAGSLPLTPPRKPFQPRPRKIPGTINEAHRKPRAEWKWCWSTWAPREDCRRANHWTESAI